MKKCFSRIGVVILAIAMLATQLVMPIAALENTKCACDPETRTGTKVDHVDATCGDYGYDVYDCDTCHGRFAKVTDLPTGEHDYVNHDAKAPTCTEIGWDAYITCNNCDLNEYKELPALGHDYADTIVDPTCTEQGYTSHDCSRCDASYKDTYVDALGHTAGDPVEENRVEPECGVEGSYDTVIYCSVCGAEIERTNDKIDALVHNYVEIERIVPELCVEDTQIIKECTLCGHQITEIIEGASEHNYDKVLCGATCTEPGYYVYTCKVCGYEITEDADKPLGHDWIDATCTEAKTCARCGITEGDALGHDYVATVVEPTCTEQGYTSYDCSRCDASYKDDYTEINPLNHVAVITKEAVAPTCTETGLTYELSCAHCSELLAKQTEIPALGHSYKGVVTEPDCENDGYTTYTCSVCGDSYVDDEVDALGHYDAITLGVVEATCLTGGHTAKKCLICGEFFKDNFVDALGHDIISVDAQAATCDTIGWDAYEYCTRCDHTTYVEIAALGHRLEKFIDLAPTCTEPGYTAHIECTRGDCDYTTFYMTFAPLGHDIVNVDAQAATCDTIGWDAHEYCTRCDHTTYVEIAALGHRLEKFIDLAPTCTEPGYTAHVECVRGDCDYATPYVNIAPLGHNEVIDEAIAPTYDEIGYTEGSHCDRCGETLKAQQVVNRVAEKVEISYEITGINGAKEVVNSGYATMNIYMTTEYARLYALTFELEIDEALEMISIQNGDSFADLTYNMLDASTIKMMFNEKMNYAGNTYEAGKYLIATLVFRVDAEFTGTAKINVNSVDYARDTEVLLNNVVLTSAESVDIKVSMLGNSNPNKDDVIDAKDVLACAKWMTNADENDYNAIYDMNKDGIIDGEDFALLRGAAVGDNEYLR